jgi:Domain of unknown function (DUF4352)
MGQSVESARPQGHPEQGNGQGQSWFTEYDPEAHRQRLRYRRPERSPQFRMPERNDPGPRRQPYGPPYQPHPQQYPPSDQPGFSPRPPYPQQREPYSQPRQPWAPQGYGQPSQPLFTPQPQYVPRPQYPPQPQYAPVPPPGRYGPRPPGRSRHTARNVIAGIGGLAVLVIGIAVAANSGHSVETAGSTAAVSNSGGGSASKTAGIGSAITLSGNGSGEQMSVTVTKVTSDASASDSFDEPPAGDRLYAVQFRLSDTGTAAYSDSPSNGAAVVDSAGQSYQSGLENVAACQSFGGTENIAAGNSGLGCIVFEVPAKAKITQIQFTLDSGMGPDTGQWDVG